MNKTHQHQPFEAAHLKERGITATSKQGLHNAQPATSKEGLLNAQPSASDSPNPISPSRLVLNRISLGSKDGCGWENNAHTDG